MIKKIFLIGLVLSSATFASAQKASVKFESSYKIAKQLLDQGKYGLSAESFKTLLASSEVNALVPYAQFYLGFASYNNGDVNYAKNAFLELTVKYSNWHKIDAANLWLSQIGFEQSGPFKGMLYASEISSEPYLSKSKKFVEAQLKHYPIETLSLLNIEYPTDKIIAEAYANALSELSSSTETSILLDSLINKFEFDRSKFNSIPISVIKEQYSIGIMLPLYIDRLEATGKYLKKSLAVDLYEGAKMAAHDTDSTLFNLQVFDTKKDSARLSVFLENGGINNLDAVLGPIYPKPVAKMMAIAS